MRKVKEKRVKITTSIQGKTVILTIDCPTDLLAGKYLGLLEDWLEDIVAKNPTRARIVENYRKKSDGGNGNA